MGYQSKRSKLITWGLLALLLVVLIAKTFFIGYYKIPQNGMYPNLPAGSSLFANKRAYDGPSSVKRGDIVIFVREQDGRKYNYIWRVVGLPGDKVEAIEGSLKINGEPVQRERLRELDGKTIFREQIGEASYEIALGQSQSPQIPNASVTVPEAHFFVMGDNRFDAWDSRKFGPIPFNSIIGKKL